MWCTMLRLILNAAAAGKYSRNDELLDTGAMDYVPGRVLWEAGGGHCTALR
jgi:hypothetical protein